MRLRQHVVALATTQPPRQRRVQRAEPERAEGQRHAPTFHQAGLQRERDQRHAEHQAAVDQVAPAGRPASREQDRNQQIHREEQHQERLRAGVFLRRIIEHAPGGRDAEGEGEAQQVEDPPGLVPGDAHDRRIQHRVIREQRDVVAAAGGQPDRREEAGEQREDRQCLGVLQHRQHAGAGDQHDADRECRTRGHHPEILERGEHHQQQHADRAALQAQREHALAVALAPGEHQRCQCCGGDAGQAQLRRHREPTLVGTVFQQ